MSRSKIVGSSSVARKDVLEVLTQDIQAHREYIQKLYRNAFYVGGVGLAAGIGLGIWILGERLDSSILQHRIDEKLEAKVEKITQDHLNDAEGDIQESASNAVAAAQNTLSSFADQESEKAKDQIAEATLNATSSATAKVDQYVSDRLSVEVRELIAPQLDKLSEASITDLAEQITLPAGFVAAFDRPAGCPEGWTNMEANWRGRTIVAASSEANDKYALGRTGGAEKHTLSIDEMPAHRHGISTSRNAGRNIHDGLAGSQEGYGIDQVFENPVGDAGSGFGSLDRILEEVGRSLPHNNMPPYIALYICRKE